MLFIALRFQEEDKRLCLDTAYVAGVENWVGGKQCKLPEERMWDVLGPMDQGYMEVARCVLRDIEQVMMGREVLKHEILRKFSK